MNLMLRIFHYSPWYTYFYARVVQLIVENLSLFALIYLSTRTCAWTGCWESFIIRLDILMGSPPCRSRRLRIFHYSPWYTYQVRHIRVDEVENLSLFALIYLSAAFWTRASCWESFIIRLDILISADVPFDAALRIFHYSPWYTYAVDGDGAAGVENLSLFALIYLRWRGNPPDTGWESFIIRLDILKNAAG